jgi:2-amino-4-hydroxy-6-hydroxymethyldihydropteridine diphosphokinase
MVSEVYLALGSNIGDREDYLKKAVEKISLIKSIKLLSVSRVYETDPVGYTDQPSFLNMAVLVHTSLLPLDLLNHLQEIENSLKRVRSIHWGPRTIDIDILLYGSLKVQLPDLIIPHPRMLERAFVLTPLKDILISGEINGVKISELIDKCSDKSGVKFHSILEFKF